MCHYRRSYSYSFSEKIIKIGKEQTKTGIFEEVFRNSYKVPNLNASLFRVDLNSEQYRDQSLNDYVWLLGMPSKLQLYLQRTKQCPINWCFSIKNYVTHLMKSLLGLYLWLFLSLEWKLHSQLYLSLCHSNFSREILPKRKRTKNERKNIILNFFTHNSVSTAICTTESYDILIESSYLW